MAIKHRLADYDYSQWVGKLCRDANDTELWLITDCYLSNTTMYYDHISLATGSGTTSPVTWFHDTVIFYTTKGNQIFENRIRK